MQKPKVVFSEVVYVNDLATSFYLSPYHELKNKTKFSLSILRACLFMVMYFTWALCCISTHYEFKICHAVWRFCHTSVQTYG